METIKILEKLTTEESIAKSNARTYTVEQARQRMRSREGDSYLPSLENGVQVVPRELFRNNPRRKTEK